MILGEVMNSFHPDSAESEWPEELRLKIADSLFNNSCEGICLTDVGERIVEIKPTFCQLSGYTKEELLNKTPRMLSSRGEIASPTSNPAHAQSPAVSISKSARPQ